MTVSDEAVCRRQTTDPKLILCTWKEEEKDYVQSAVGEQPVEKLQTESINIFLHLSDPETPQETVYRWVILANNNLYPFMSAWRCLGV